MLSWSESGVIGGAGKFPRQQGSKRTRIMQCPICGQVASNIAEYEVHKRLRHAPWLVQLAAVVVLTVVLTAVLTAVVTAAPKVVAKLT